MEEERIRRAKAGDTQAFEQLMTPYENKIYALCLRMMGNAHDGEDAAQEAMLRIWQKLAQYRGESGFSTWVYRVTASCCTDAIRARARRQQPSLEVLRDEGFEPKDQAPTPHQEAEKTERRRAMEQAVADVPEGMRMVFLLRDVHGLSVEDTAKALGVSQGTVKSRLSRAREKIAGSLHASGLFDRGSREEKA